MLHGDNPFFRRALELAREIHDGQTYGGDDDPYEFHLFGVGDILIAAGLDDLDYAIFSMLHDTIEDVAADRREETTERVKEITTERSFGMIWAVTGLGPNRKARNADAYAKIKGKPEAANGKLADRIMNMEQAKAKGTRHFDMYMKEDEAFRDNVVRYADNEYLIRRYEAVASRA